MKTKILKKINERIRIIPENDLFVVQHRNKIGFGGRFENWHELKSFSSFKRAIDKKNSYIVMVILRDLGYRNEFVKRRTIRKNPISF
jgi:hypothetical protein